MSLLMLKLSLARRRKWIGMALAMTTLAGCIRFRNDAPADAGPDGSVAPDIDADLPPEGGDAVVPLPPVCEGFMKPEELTDQIAGDLIARVTKDCSLSAYFAGLPPVALAHFQECLAAQMGQVMGCRHPDGEPFRYPTLDSKMTFCRDMKSSHKAFALSAGDFEAFLAAMDLALQGNGLNEEQSKRVLTVFRSTQRDITRTDAGDLTKPCDAGDDN